jgi:hypothetical protein
VKGLAAVLSGRDLAAIERANALRILPRWFEPSEGLSRR